VPKIVKHLHFVGIKNVNKKMLSFAVTTNVHAILPIKDVKEVVLIWPTRSSVKNFNKLQLLKYK
jgi:hypothetical protein